ncbi:alpha/beta fold hydrolase [Planococcus chinensis]|uniref:Alpha/beta fold hydrolase n=1 Tax=Planococcus chinensis TaxID=272917 RepID=A0ABW4QJM4_9BACL
MSNWEQKLIKTDRGIFEVFTKGNGEPICVTHHYSVFNKSGDYFGEAFTGTHQVFLVNLREAGQSERAHASYELSMLETVFDLEAVRKALGFEQWGFAGHSTGGMLGIIYGIHYSESLQFLIIAGAAAREYATFSANCIYNQAHPSFQKMQQLIESLKNPDLAEGQRKNLSAERTALSLYRPDRYSELFHLPITKTISAARMNFFNRELPIFDVTRKLSLIQVPTLILCGRHDVQCPLEYSLEMNVGIRDSKFVIFNESNHYPFLEEKDKFSNGVASFLKEL